MAQTTGIAWTDATFNPWLGCTKVGPGCEHCYAEDLVTRRMGLGWGDDAPRRRTAESTWKQPRAWNRAREQGRPSAPLWVFCASLADVFDNKVDPEWRADLWRLIEQCPHLRWQLCTKRITNVRKMVPDHKWFRRNQHVGLLITTVTQEEVDRDVPRLLKFKQDHEPAWVGLSVEPQIERIGICPPHIGTPDLDWVICGGESGSHARPFNLDWARTLRDDCRYANVPFFMKQVGARAHVGIPRNGYRVRDRAGTDPDEWPPDLRVREMPRVYDRAPPSSLLFA